MLFLYPIYLLLAIPLGVSLALWGFRSRWLLGLRLVTLVLVVLALAGLTLKLPSQAGTVMVVADRSWSMPVDAESKQVEAIGLIQEAMGPDDRLGVIAFGRGVALERPPGPRGKFPGFQAEVGNDASELAEALEFAQSLIPDGAPGRILLFADGQWTGSEPSSVAARLAQRGIALDYRPLQRAITGDVAIARIDAPTSVHAGESFLLHAWIQAPAQQAIYYELRRGAEVLAAGKKTIDSGLTRLTFRDQAGPAGVQGYVLTVRTKEADPVPENNTARLLLGVDGPKPMLVVPSGPKSSFARLLTGGGLEVRTAPPDPKLFTLEELAKYSAVVLENIPADDVGYAGMETLAAWVQHAGAGLMFTGGRASYGPGGYFKSPLDPIMPVSMELRQEHRKLSLAIVVALDRSGSMAVPVAGGKVKMDLANLGTVQVLDLLAPNDEFGCLAVDSAPHVVQDLATVGSSKAAVRSKILGINSEGGGIFVYEALEAAHGMLQRAKAGTRHIILFADAADAEEPKQYEKILARCRAENITVSVIGLGREADKDGALLKDIAAKGKGRVFFTERPEDLPRLFAQDTFVVARSAFLDEPTPIKATAGLTVLLGKEFAPTQLGGYNLCYLRPAATLGSVTLDEYKAPVLAAWQAGTGRVLCFTGEADGKYTGALAGWPDVGAFFTSLARWTTGKQGPLPAGMLLTQDLKKGIAHVQLHLDPKRREEPFAVLPEVTVLRAWGDKKPRSDKVKLQWQGADVLEADIPLAGTETILATVDIPGHGAISLSPACLPYAAEFEPTASHEGAAESSASVARLGQLERLARLTGGKERIELPSIWEAMVRRPRLIALAPWLLIAAIVVFLLEVLQRLTGLLSRGMAFAPASRRAEDAEGKNAAMAKAHAPATTPPTTQPTPTPTAPPPSMPEPAPSPAGIVDALREARKRGRTRQPPQ